MYSFLTRLGDFTVPAIEPETPSTLPTSLFVHIAVPCSNADVLNNKILLTIYCNIEWQLYPKVYNYGK